MMRIWICRNVYLHICITRCIMYRKKPYFVQYIHIHTFSHHTKNAPNADFINI